MDSLKVSLYVFVSLPAPMRLKDVYVFKDTDSWKERANLKFMLLIRYTTPEGDAETSTTS